MRHARTLALAAAMVVITLSAGWAAAAKSEVGVIEWDRVLEGYTAYKDAAQQQAQFQSAREKILQDRMQTRMLTEAELKEYNDLRKQAAPTEAQTKRMQELAAISDTLDKELADLTALATRTPEQEKRMAELTKLRDDGQAAVTNLRAQLIKEVQDESTRLMQPLQDRLNKAIADVAAQNKLTVVLEKGSVLFGGEDITDKVLAQVNKK